MVPYRAHECSESGELKAADGTALFYRRWHPVRGSEKGAVLLVHGLGEHSGRYGHVANVFTELGFEVWAHDHRGFGRSQGARARIPARETLIEDTKNVFETMCAGNGGRPAWLLGHSMGGAIAARAVTGGWINPAALILSSPALKSYIGSAMRHLTGLLEKVAPNLAVPHGLPLQTISHDPEVLADAATDPLNHALITARMTMFILDAGEAAIRDAGKLKVPVLIQAAGADRLVDPSGATAFAAAASAGLCTLKIYEGLGHEVYNEQEPDRTRVLGDLRDWTRSHA